jgi:hypothetical protein
MVNSPKSQSGQAATEYLIIAVGVSLALTMLGFAVPWECESALTGKMAPCKSVNHAMQEMFQNMVSDVTVLLNLPY